MVQNVRACIKLFQYGSASLTCTTILVYIMHSVDYIIIDIMHDCHYTLPFVSDMRNCVLYIADEFKSLLLYCAIMNTMS